MSSLETRNEAAVNRTGKLAAIVAHVNKRSGQGDRTPLRDITHSRNKDLSPEEGMKIVVMYHAHLRPGNKRVHRDDMKSLKAELGKRNVSYKACLKASSPPPPTCALLLATRLTMLSS